MNLCQLAGVNRALLPWRAHWGGNKVTNNVFLVPNCCRELLLLLSISQLWQTPHFLPHAREVFTRDKARLIKLSATRQLYLPAPTRSRKRSAHSGTSGSVISARTCELYYLGWLGLALYPVLVLAAPLPGRGAVLSVPAALPPLVFLTSETSRRKQIVKNKPIAVL